MGAVAGRVRACSWDVGAQIRPVGSQAPNECKHWYNARPTVILPAKEHCHCLISYPITEGRKLSERECMADYIGYIYTSRYTANGRPSQYCVTDQLLHKLSVASLM